jgi:hypothetical protein
VISFSRALCGRDTAPQAKSLHPGYGHGHGRGRHCAGSATPPLAFCRALRGRDTGPQAKSLHPGCGHGHGVGRHCAGSATRPRSPFAGLCVAVIEAPKLKAIAQVLDKIKDHVRTLVYIGQAEEGLLGQAREAGLKVRSGGAALTARVAGVHARWGRGLRCARAALTARIACRGRGPRGWCTVWHSAQSMQACMHARWGRGSRCAAGHSVHGGCGPCWFDQSTCRAYAYP